MRATQDRQVITLFGGECVSPNYRGRRSAPQLSKQTSRRVAVVFGALLIGFATAATAITIKRHSTAMDGFIPSMPANLMIAPGAGGFEEAIY